MSTLNTRKIKHDSSAVDNITLTSNGRVGIATNSPTQRFVAYDPTGGSDNIVMCESSAGQKIYMQADSGQQKGVLGTLSNHPLAFVSNNIERMRIDASGRVTMPYQPAFRAGYSNAPTKTTGDILVFDNVYANRGSCYNSSNGRFTAPTYGLYFFSFIDNLNRDTSSWAGIYWRKNGSTVGLIYDDTSSAWVNISGTIILELNVGDYVELTCGGSSGGTTQFDSANYGGVMGYLLG